MIRAPLSDAPMPRAVRATPLAALLGAAFVGLTASAGCVEVCDVVDCSGTTGTNGPGGGSAGGGGGGGEATGGAGPSTSSTPGQGGSGGGGGSGPIATCEPEAGAIVGDDCGVFVDAQAPEGGDGSKASPLRTLTAAVALAATGTGRVYVCSTTELDEAVDVPTGFSLFGGVDCASGAAWSLEARTTWTAPVDAIPLRVPGNGGTVRIAGFAITARPASEGGSSIAALAEGGMLVVERSSLVAGAGGVGVAGVTGATGLSGMSATNANGGNGCNGAANAGGKGGSCVNDVCGAGEPGNPQGAGGAQGTGGTMCLPGGDAPGVTGFGSTGMPEGLGTITAEGFVPDEGQPGGEGPPGAGGGGGGAKSLGGGFNFSGGGGGGGGCGGKGGSGAGGGGASIALVLLGATAQLDEVVLVSNRGGDGGLPGEGGAAGPGGSGAPAGNSCAGGAGASGGLGGGGGGGRGGPSALVAYKGTSAPSLALVTDSNPELRAGGTGSGNADDGQFDSTLVLP